MSRATVINSSAQTLYEISNTSTCKCFVQLRDVCVRLTHTSCRMFLIDKSVIFCSIVAAF
jgi:hypothetical protein